VVDILATVKPGLSLAEDVAKISSFARIGVTAIRVNLGRRKVAENRRVLTDAMSGIAEPLLTFVDLPGVKGRLGDVGASALAVAKGDAVVLIRSNDDAPAERGAIPYRVPAGEDGPAEGDLLALDDGRLVLQVRQVSGSRITCVVEDGSLIPRFTGVVIVSGGGPDGHLTAADRHLARAVRQDTDYLCPSFADSSATIEQLQHPELRPRRGIVAKIETPRGVRGLDELARASSGLMLARGDLSSFYGGDEMREIAVTLTAAARKHHKLVVLATNYFRGLAAPPFRLSDQERRTLDHVGVLQPDFLLLNETAFSPNWEQVAAEAVRYSQSWKEVA
jgi:pyruvate kinase